MKIGFIEPVYRESFAVFNPFMSKFVKERRDYLPVWNNPELGLLTVAALMPRGWEIEYIHSFFDEIDYEEKFDIIALGGMTRQAEDIYEIAKNFKERGVYIAAGGIHATTMPAEMQEHADTVFAGEAEETFPRFIEDYMNNKAKPLYRSQVPADMTKSPLPRFDLLKQDYRNYPIQTTRGCPHNCNFCSISRIYGKNHRHKEVAQVIEEIKFLKSVKRSPFVIFVDNNMFVDKSFSYELVEKLIPLDIKWQAQTDVSVGKDKEFLKLLFRAGCKELFIGFESVNPENIKHINKSRWKSQRVSLYKTIVKNIREKGIRVFGAFILGFDKDTKDDFTKIEKFVIENKILGQFSVLTPLPGTELYEEFKKSGRLLKNKSWQHYNFLDCVISHPNFSVGQLEKAVARLWEITYSREHYARVLSSLIEAHKKMAPGGCGGPAGGQT
ncbi:MAG: B12-binding domain-containing radical SAM protein, partial [Candidatus Aminicenantes bacterium]|nr:B12-binding domain-containing radical SAM protein [Candidatus Aminicenantes bacterium]